MTVGPPLPTECPTCSRPLDPDLHCCKHCEPEEWRTRDEAMHDWHGTGEYLTDEDMEAIEAAGVM